MASEELLGLFIEHKEKAETEAAALEAAVAEHPAHKCGLDLMTAPLDVPFLVNKASGRDHRVAHVVELGGRAAWQKGPRQLWQGAPMDGRRRVLSLRPPRSRRC